MTLTRTGATTLLAGLTLVGGVSMAAPASAANNTSQNGGLVNLALVDTNVQLPVSIAANVCGVAVNVLASATATSPVTCTATGVTAARNSGGDSSNTQQSGLVNVAIVNTNVQVPIGIAANICGVAANVLSSLTFTSPVTCAALGGSTAA